MTGWKRSTDPRGRVGELFMLLLFAAVVAWSVYELFLPHPAVVSKEKTALRPYRLKPDPILLARRVRETAPAPVQSAWHPLRLDNRWEWIVIHHSATFIDNAESMGRYHAKERKMKNGLAYHFVIGNGSRSQDGEVELGKRWRQQLDGGHVHGDELNRVSIGICLVGNFEESMPTAKQIASLKGVLNYLFEVTRIQGDRVKGHRLMLGQKTLCPGKYLPVEEIVQYRNVPSR